MVEDENAPPIPDGWYAVGWSTDVSPGEVRRILYFDEELALFRTRTGVPRVVSAYCPHLGAHLAEGGRVAGETIRCPFHAWQYDGETGKCVKIPYCDRRRPGARHRDQLRRGRALHACRQLQRAGDALRHLQDGAAA